MNDATNDGRWEDVVKLFREYCQTKRANLLAEADRLFTGPLSRAIAAWSRQTPGMVETKRARLHAMFAVEQKRLHETAPQDSSPLRVAFDTAPSSWRGSLARQLAPAPRIRFDDIPAALDHILAEQRQATVPIPFPA